MAASRITEEAVERELVCQGLLLLGFDPSKYSFKFHSEMFLQHNTKGFLEVVHFLLHTLAADKANQLFRGCYPIVARNQEQDFRKAAITWLKELDEGWELGLPSNLPSLFLSPSGRKVHGLLLLLIQVVLQRELLGGGEMALVGPPAPVALAGLVQETSRQTTASLQAHAEQHLKWQSFVNDMEADIKQLQAAKQEVEELLEQELPGYLENEALLEAAMLDFYQSAEKVSLAWEQLQGFIRSHQAGPWPLLTSLLDEGPTPLVLSPVPAVLPPLVSDCHLLHQHNLRRLHDNNKLNLESFLKLLQIVAPLYSQKIQDIPDQEELLLAVKSRNKDIEELRASLSDLRRQMDELPDPLLTPRPIPPAPLPLPVISEEDWAVLLPPLLESRPPAELDGYLKPSARKESLGCFSPLHLESSSFSLQQDYTLAGDDDLLTSLLSSPAQSLLLATPPRKSSLKSSISPSIASLVARFRAIKNKSLEDN